MYCGTVLKSIQLMYLAYTKWWWHISTKNFILVGQKDSNWNTCFTLCSLWVEIMCIQWLLIFLLPGAQKKSWFWGLGTEASCIYASRLEKLNTNIWHNIQMWCVIDKSVRGSELTLEISIPIARLGETMLLVEIICVYNDALVYH